MSEETIVKIKMATIASVGVAVLSLAVVVLGWWVTSLNADYTHISKTVSTHGEEIATLRECAKNQQGTLTRIETTLDAVRNDQIRRQKQEMK